MPPIAGGGLVMSRLFLFLALGLGAPSLGRADVFLWNGSATIEGAITGVEIATVFPVITDLGFGNPASGGAIAEGFNFVNQSHLDHL
jgi:hypothetical protein